MRRRGSANRSAIVLALALVCASDSARAQATPRVPTTDRVYADIDRLAALGLIDHMVAGQRPYSEREIARLLDEASLNLERAPRARGWATAAIARDRARLPGSRLRLLEQADVTATALDSPFRAIPADGDGSVDASINPLVAYSQGRPFAGRGATFGVETRSSALITRHVAAWINPRLTTFAGSADGPAGTTATQLRLQSGGADFLFGNLAVDAGRDYEIFAQSPTGGIELSNDAPAFNAVQITNERPARLPGFLSGIGLMKATAFVADLGAHTAHPHSLLIAYKVSAQIVRHFEFGFQVEDEMGGSGAQKASFVDRILDLIPPIDAFRTGSEFLFSNKMAGVDFHVRVPSFAGFELYADGAVDDMDARRFKSSFFNDGGIVSGFAFSCLVNCGRTTIRAEYHQTGIRYYTHTLFPDGFASNHTLWGDPLGPRGLGAYGMVENDLPRLGRISVDGAYEIRSGNLYESADTQAHDGNFHFVQRSHAPGELRRRLIVDWESLPDSRQLSLSGGLGVERVMNFAFQSGSNRTNLLARLGAEWRPR